MSSTSSNAVMLLLSEIDAAHLGIAAHLLRRAVGDHAALMQHRDLLRDGEHDVHVVLGEQQRELALLRDALRAARSVSRVSGADMPAVGSSSSSISGSAGQRDAKLELLLIAVGQRAADRIGLSEQPERAQQLPVSSRI